MKSCVCPTLLILLIAVSLAGCPWLRPREIPEFTSARETMTYRGSPALDGSAPDVEFEDEVSGEAPRELVEPDVIRRRDDLLYVLNQYRGLTIVDLGDEVVLSQTPTYGYPRDLYLVGEHAYVLVSYARGIHVADDLVRVSYGSKLYVLNIQDPTNVFEEGAFSFEGDLIDSRMVGDVIYAVSSEYTWYTCCGDGPVATDTAHKSWGSTGAVSINIADPDDLHMVDTVAFEGYGNLIHATNYALFVTANDYNAGVSRITYVDIDDPTGDIRVRGSADAPGYMADRFKMDAWDGTLRVVTNTWWPDLETYVTTFDISDPDVMAQLGQTTLESASGEQLFATRFDGPTAYIVTYFMVDPLFVVDLSDPAAPAVVGELKIPGWSTHIEPRGDRLIALGVDDEDGWRVMVSLFDVSDPADPQRLDYASFGDGWSWSSAYSDVKAFTVLDDLLLVPFSGWNHGTGVGYDRLQFVAYDRDALDVQGYVDLQGSVVRSFPHAGRVYAVTQEQLAVIDAQHAAAPVIETSLTLAENVSDVLPLEDGQVVEVIVRNDTGDTLLRAVNYDEGTAGASVIIPAGHISEAFVWNNAVVLVAPAYVYEPVYRGYYRVFLVDFSDYEAPTLVREWEADIEPWWGGWWGGWWRDGVMPEPGFADAASKGMMYYPWYYPTGSTAFLAGDYLALRGHRERYATVAGDADAFQGLAVIDLADVDPVRYLGLGYDHVAAISEADNLLYITTSREAGLNRPGGASHIAYYLQTVNPYTLAPSAPVNVPGVFKHKVPGTAYLLLEDLQYTRDWNTATVLRCVTISGDRATLVDSAALPEGYWDIKAHGADLYFAGMHYRTAYAYDDGDISDSEPGFDGPTAGRGKSDETFYKVGRYSVARSGAWIEGDVRDVSPQWCALLGAQSQQAYLTVSGSVIARYDFMQSPPALAATAPTMSHPAKIRFGAEAAYVPLGYGGVVVLD